MSSDAAGRAGKHVDRSDLPRIRARADEAGRTVVFTNGCFDLLHPGHVHTLDQASRLGDCLVVGLNSDASVRRLKGEGRPVDPVATRIANLAALQTVDHVVVFEEDTPIPLLELLRPDVLVKGGDYDLDRIVGRELVESWGGRVTTVPYLEGHSTTDRLTGSSAKRRPC